MVNVIKTRGETASPCVVYLRDTSNRKSSDPICTKAERERRVGSSVSYIHAAEKSLAGISQIYQGGNNNQEIAGVAK